MGQKGSSADRGADLSGAAVGHLKQEIDLVPGLGAKVTGPGPAYNNPDAGITRTSS